MNYFFFFMIDEATRTRDVEVTNNTRAIRWSDGDKEKIIFTNYIVN